MGGAPGEEGEGVGVSLTHVFQGKISIWRHKAQPWFTMTPWLSHSHFKEHLFLHVAKTIPAREGSQL